MLVVAASSPRICGSKRVHQVYQHLGDLSAEPKLDTEAERAHVMKRMK